MLRETGMDSGSYSLIYATIHIFISRLTHWLIGVTMPEEPKKVKAGGTVGPGKYVCVDCGFEYSVTGSEADLRKCPSCACEFYNCLPMTHIRPDIKTPEDARHPPER